MLKGWAMLTDSQLKSARILGMRDFATPMKCHQCQDEGRAFREIRYLSKTFRICEDVCWPFMKDLKRGM